MSLSTYVVGIVPPDDQWRRMKKVYDACGAANVAVPRDVLAFFGDTAPDNSGVILDQNQLNQAVTKYDGDEESGLEVDLEKLPKHVKKLRFINSY